MKYLKLDATHNETIIKEHELVDDGYEKVCPKGYDSFLKGTHYKAYYSKENFFWVIEGSDEVNSSYIIEQII